MEEREACQELVDGMIKRYAFPVIGDTPVDRVDRTDVLAILKPMWTTKPEPSAWVRQRT